MDKLAMSYAAAIHDTTEPLRRAMLLADGIFKLKAAINKEIMQKVMSLMNTPLGFKTDCGPHSKRNPQPYQESVVKDCLIAALLNGVYPVGNEFNIIAGQCYVTKEGYQRKMRELDGVTDLAVAPGVPIVRDGQTVIRMAVTWIQDGHKCQLKSADGKPGRAFVIPADQYTGPDAIVGKATRKALKAAYEQITGSTQTLPEPDDDATETTETAKAAETAAPTANGKAPEPEKPPEPEAAKQPEAPPERQPGEDDPELPDQPADADLLWDNCLERVRQANTLREADFVMRWAFDQPAWEAMRDRHGKLSEVVQARKREIDEAKKPEQRKARTNA